MSEVWAGPPCSFFHGMWVAKRTDMDLGPTWHLLDELQSHNIPHGEPRLFETVLCTCPKREDERRPPRP